MNHAMAVTGILKQISMNPPFLIFSHQINRARRVFLLDSMPVNCYVQLPSLHSKCRGTLQHSHGGCAPAVLQENYDISNITITAATGWPPS
eukprot:scaffold455179_cov18-Prasinocladus_malaysianus.AAC.2